MEHGGQERLGRVSPAAVEPGVRIFTEPGSEKNRTSRPLSPRLLMLFESLDSEQGINISILILNVV